MHSFAKLLQAHSIVAVWGTAGVWCVKRADIPTTGCTVRKVREVAGGRSLNIDSCCFNVSMMFQIVLKLLRSACTDRVSAIRTSLVPKDVSDTNP